MKISKIYDYYFKHSILCDVVVMALFLTLSFFISPILTKLQLPLVNIPNKGHLVNCFGYLSSASITFAGFIIASLTIMISVRSSLKARGFDDAHNALEYLFTTKHYESIVKVFIWSIIELIILFILLYIFWFLIESINEKNSFRIILVSTYGVITSVFRSLYILFKVLKLEFLVRK